jgi:hypothetical protein
MQMKRNNNANHNQHPFPVSIFIPEKSLNSIVLESVKTYDILGNFFLASVIFKNDLSVTFAIWG